MRRSLTAAAIALLMTTVAHAEKSTDILLYRGDYWSTRIIASSDDKKPMCVATAGWTFKNGDMSLISMKWTVEGGLFLHISKYSWSFATNLTDIPLAISFDNGYREGTGFSFDNNGKPMIQTSIAADNAMGFVEDFANAKTMTITFKSGNERPWVANMKGSRGAVKAFAQCVVKIAESLPGGPQATSPVNPQATSPVGPQTTSPVGGKSTIKKDDGSI